MRVGELIEHLRQYDEGLEVSIVVSVETEDDGKIGRYRSHQGFDERNMEVRETFGKSALCVDVEA